MCAYWVKREEGGERDANMERRMEESGPGIAHVCQLVTLGNLLLPDNLPPFLQDIQNMFNAEVEIMQLESIILKGTSIHNIHSTAN